MIYWGFRNLTCDVASATGAKEAKFDTKGKANSSIIPTPRGINSSFKTISFLPLINEDEKMVHSTEEEDGEGYKCDNRNDDDDFVDLKDEWWSIIVNPSVF